MIGCLVAIDLNYGIGFENSMPWPRLNDDMKWFQKITKNNVIVMGSNTWSSIGEKLEDRINVVISKNQIDFADHVFNDPLNAIKDLSILYPQKNIFIIGGQKLYDSTLNIVDTFYITHINDIYHCDRFFDFSYVQKNCTKANDLFFFDKEDNAPSYIIREYHHETSRTSIS
jgi:dihydrofolate reductase